MPPHSQLLVWGKTPGAEAGAAPRLEPPGRQGATALPALPRLALGASLAPRAGRSGAARVRRQAGSGRSRHGSRLREAVAAECRRGGGGPRRRPDRPARQ